MRILAGAVACWVGLASVSAAAERPNVVVFLADDQGWGDLSLHGNVNLQTPVLDKLGRQGATFDRFFVQPVCAPTRAEFLTGRFFSRTGVRGVSTGEERLDPAEETVAEVFRRGGYATGAFGKWHNGSQAPYDPNSQGFQEFLGFTSGHWGDYFGPVLEHNGELVASEGYLQDHLVTKAIEFIESNRGRPFFCYVPLVTPHSPMQVPDKWWRKFEGKKLALGHWQENPKGEDHVRAALAMVENIDWNVGRVIETLEELGVGENTIVVYFSDNGPNSYRWNGDMKGRKSSVDEGGVRVPCLVRWPGRIPAGTVVERIAGAVDLLPTLAAAAGLERESERPLDGVNLLPWLKGERRDVPERLMLALEYENGGVNYGVRSQRFRWIANDGLYEPAADPRQSRELTVEHPRMTAAMVAFADAYLAEVAGALKPDDRPFTVGFAPLTWLPARDGVPVGEVERSSPAPNCSFFRNWMTADDGVDWHVEVGEGGDYEAELHFTCPPENVGVVLELSAGESRTSAKVGEAFDPPLRGAENDRSARYDGESLVKDFRPLSLGRLRLEPGRTTLKLRALEIPGAGAVDVRWLRLVRAEAGGE